MENCPIIPHIQSIGPVARRVRQADRVCPMQFYYKRLLDAVKKSGAAVSTALAYNMQFPLLIWQKHVESCEKSMDKNKIRATTNTHTQPATTTAMTFIYCCCCLLFRLCCHLCVFTFAVEIFVVI